MRLVASVSKTYPFILETFLQMELLMQKKLSDGSDSVVVGAQTVDVGPPQTQLSGSCRAL